MWKEALAPQMWMSVVKAMGTMKDTVPKIYKNSLKQRKISLLSQLLPSN
jgi:hypothetical protein